MKYEVLKLKLPDIKRILSDLPDKQLTVESMIDQNYDNSTKEFLTFIIELIKKTKQAEEQTLNNNIEKINQLVLDSNKFIDKYFTNNGLIDYYSNTLQESLERIKSNTPSNVEFDVDEIKAKILTALKTIYSSIYEEKIKEINEKIVSLKNEFVESVKTKFNKVTDSLNVPINSEIKTKFTSITNTIHNAVNALMIKSVPQSSKLLNMKLNLNFKASVSRLVDSAKNRFTESLVKIKTNSTKNIESLKTRFEKYRKIARTTRRAIKYNEIKFKRKLERSDNVSVFIKYGAIGLMIKVANDLIRKNKTKFIVPTEMNFKPFRLMSLNINTLDEFMNNLTEHMNIVASNIKLYLDKNILESYNARRKLGPMHLRRRPKQKPDVFNGDESSWLDNLISFFTSLPDIVRVFGGWRKFFRSTWRILKDSARFCWRVGNSFLRGTSRVLGRAFERLGMRFGWTRVTRYSRSMQAWGLKGKHGFTAPKPFRFSRGPMTKLRIFIRRVRHGQWSRILHKRAWLRRWGNFKNLKIFHPRLLLDSIKTGIRQSKIVQFFTRPNSGAGLIRTLKNLRPSSIVNYIKSGKLLASGANIFKNISAGARANPYLAIASFAIDGFFAYKDAQDDQLMSDLFGIDKSEVGAQQRTAYTIAGTLAGPGLLDADWSTFGGAASGVFNAVGTVSKWAVIGGLVGGPIGAAIGAGLGLVFSVVGTERLAKGINALCNGVKKAWGGIVNFTKGVWKWTKKIGGFLLNPFPAIASGAKKLWSGAKALCGKLFKKLGDWGSKLKNKFKSIKDGLINKAKQIKDKIKNSFKNVKNKIKNSIKAVSGFFKNVFGKIKERRNRFFNKIKQKVLSSKAYLIGLLKKSTLKFFATMKIIKSTVKNLRLSIRTIGKNIQGNTKKKLATLLLKAGSNFTLIGGITKTLKFSASKMVGNAKSTINKAFDTANFIYKASTKLSTYVKIKAVTFLDSIFNIRNTSKTVIEKTKNLLNSNYKTLALEYFKFGGILIVLTRRLKSKSINLTGDVAKSPIKFQSKTIGGKLVFAMVKHAKLNNYISYKMSSTIDSLLGNTVSLLKDKVSEFNEKAVKVAKFSLKQSLFGNAFANKVIGNALGIIKTKITGKVDSYVSSILKSNIESLNNIIKQKISKRIDSITDKLDEITGLNSSIKNAVIAIEAPGIKSLNRTIQSSNSSDSGFDLTGNVERDIKDIDQLTDIIDKLFDVPPGIIPVPISEDEKEVTNATIAAEHWLEEDEKEFKYFFENQQLIRV